MPSSQGMDVLQALHSADGIFCVDRAQRIVHWSPSAQEILGYAPGDVLGRPCYEVVGGRDSQNLTFCRSNCPIMTNARRGRLTADYDVLSRRKDGSDAWVNISILLLKPGRGQAPLVVHVFRDVTERRRVEGLARQAVETLQVLSRGLEAGPGGRTVLDTRRTPAPPLSRRELQVLHLLASGLDTDQIAQHLGISPITARNHITHLVAKLGARNRLQAVLQASRRGLV